MPNHISHHVTFEYDEGSEVSYKKHEEAVLAVKEKMKTPDREFDFNVLIPYPKEYADADEQAYKHDQEGKPYASRPKDGFNHGGYEWCCDNWGTKWNAYGVVWSYDELYFQTAWNTPLPILEALSREFPDVTIKVEYADEDIGSNCGTIILKGGTIIHEDNAETMDNSRLFADRVYHEYHHRFYYAQLEAEEAKTRELEHKLSDIGKESV